MIFKWIGIYWVILFESHTYAQCNPQSCEIRAILKSERVSKIWGKFFGLVKTKQKERCTQQLNNTFCKHLLINYTKTEDLFMVLLNALGLSHGTGSVNITTVYGRN